MWFLSSHLCKRKQHAGLFVECHATSLFCFVPCTLVEATTPTSVRRRTPALIKCAKATRHGVFSALIVMSNSIARDAVAVCWRLIGESNHKLPSVYTRKQSADRGNRQVSDVVCGRMRECRQGNSMARAEERACILSVRTRVSPTQMRHHICSAATKH